MDLSWFSSTSQNDLFVDSQTPDLWRGTSKPAPTDAQYTISLWLVAGSHQSLEESCIEAIGTFQWFRWAASSHLHQLLDRISQHGNGMYRWQYLFDNICFENGVRCFCYVLSRSQPEICMFVQVQSSMLYWLAIVTATFSRAIRSCIIFRSESDD